MVPFYFCSSLSLKRFKLEISHSVRNVTEQSINFISLTNLLKICTLTVFMSFYFEKCEINNNKKSCADICFLLLCIYL